MRPERARRNGDDWSVLSPGEDRAADPLDALARELRRPVEAPGLWARIEVELAGRAAGARTARRCFAAAAAAALFGAAILFFQAPAQAPPALLMDRAQAARAAREQGRLEAELAAFLPAFETRARSKSEAALFSADQLAYLDAGLEDCRAALASNPLNREVRRAFLACTRKKMEILRTFLKP